MKKFDDIWWLVIFITILGLTVSGCKQDSIKTEHKNDNINFNFGSRIKIKGTVACLPKKGEGPHTMECAYGLKTDSTYYGLKKIPDRVLKNGLLQKGKDVTVQGTVLKSDSTSTYKIAAVIKVDSIALTRANGIQDWEQVHKQQFTMLIPPHWPNEYLFAETWSSLYPQIEGATLFAVHTPNEFLKDTNFGGLQITVGKSSLEKAVANCLAPLENRANAKHRKVTINNNQFTVIQVKEAATGDRYITTSYRTKQNGACWAVETVLNYAPIEFYGKESGVTEFNLRKIKEKIQAIVHTFAFK